LGIEFVGQLAAIPREKLEEVFGLWGEALYRKARGQDAYEFWVDAEPKSISHNHTFGADTGDAALLHATLSRLGQMAGKRLRDHALRARTVSVTIRYASFRTITRERTLPEPTDLDPLILETVRQLFDAHWDRSKMLRLVGVELSSLTHGGEQLHLLEAGRRERLEKLARATDRLRDRFGFGSVQLGGALPVGTKTEKRKSKSENRQLKSDD